MADPLSIRAALLAARASNAGGEFNFVRDLQAVWRPGPEVSVRENLERMLAAPPADGWQPLATPALERLADDHRLVGAAFDGDAWFVSYCDERTGGLVKFDADLTVELARMPLEGRVGGIACAVYHDRPRVLVPIERDGDPPEVRAIARDFDDIMAFALVREGDSPTGWQAPWFAHNPGNGRIYTSVYTRARRLEAFDPAHEFRHDPDASITLDRELPQVQGAAFDGLGRVHVSLAEHAQVLVFSALTGALLGKAPLPIPGSERRGGPSVGLVTRAGDDLPLVLVASAPLPYVTLAVGLSELRAAIRARLGEADNVVWARDGSELRVEPRSLQLRMTGGFLVADVVVEAQEFGRVRARQVVFLGDAKTGAGRTAGVMHDAATPPLLVDAWGDALRAAVWEGVLDIIEGAAVAASRVAGVPLRVLGFTGGEDRVQVAVGR